MKKHVRLKQTYTNNSIINSNNAKCTEEKEKNCKQISVYCFNTIFLDASYCCETNSTNGAISNATKGRKFLFVGIFAFGIHLSWR